MAALALAFPPAAGASRPHTPARLTDIAGVGQASAQAARAAVERMAAALAADASTRPPSAMGMASLPATGAAQGSGAVGGAVMAADAEADVLANARDLYRRLSRQPFAAPSPSERAGPADAGADVATASASRQGSALLARAQAYQGVPYRWGGHDPDGVDCSGLVVRTAADLGRQLPHSAAALFQLGEPVARDSLRPGDLVFFSNTYKPGVSHVGIYSGGSTFLAASSTAGKVTAADLDHAYFRSRYAGARRLSLGERGVQGARAFLPTTFGAIGRALSAPFSLGP